MDNPMSSAPAGTLAVAPVDTPSAAAPQPPSLRRFYSYKLVSGMEFTSGVWILYLQRQGLSLTEIGLAESAFHLAPVLLEIPSGSFADLVGRRWSLAIGALLVAISTALLFAADSLPMAALALFLNGASYSFRSGADQAWLYDSLGERATGFAGILGRLLGASYLVAGAALWIGAALSDSSFTWPFILTISCSLAAVWLAVGLKEPPKDTVSEHHSVLSHLGQVATAIRQRPLIAGMLLLSGMFWTAGTIPGLYLQAAFSDRGMSNGSIGLVLGLSMVVTAFGAAAADRFLPGKRFVWQLIPLTVLAGLGIMGAASELLLVAATAYIVSELAAGVLEPLLFAWFNRNIPSGQRATLLSVDSWIFSLTMIGAFPLGGWLAETYGWAALYLLCGGWRVLLGLAALLAALLWRPRGGDSPAAPLAA